MCDAKTLTLETTNTQLLAVVSVTVVVLSVVLLITTYGGAAVPV